MTGFTTYCYPIIPHPDGTAVLLIHNGKTWALPELRIDDYQNTHQINQAVQQALGLKVVALRCLSIDYDDQHVSLVYMMENLSSAWVIFPVGEWVPPDELASLEATNTHHEVLLEDWLEETEPPDNRVPWAQPGWFEATRAWILRHLREHSIRARTPIQQVRAWARGCLLRVSTRGSDLYCKATPDAREPALMKWLAEDYPHHMPDMIACEPENQRVLMRDFQGKPLYQCQRLATWEKALRQYAELQIAQTNYIESLHNMDCPDRRLHRLPASIDDLLSTAHSDLAADELDHLRMELVRFKSMCTTLFSYDVPCALVHGDFHADNIAVCGDRIIFYDWADAAISYPLFDLAHFLHTELRSHHMFPNIPDAWKRLQIAYLEPWTQFEPMERLQSAFETTYPLMMLYQAVSYYQTINSMEPAAHHELTSSLYRWLKTLLAYA